MTLNPESGREATVAWADTGAGTATSGVDYATVAGGTLTFAAGETRKTVAATVTGDRTDEADETVIVRLSAPTNAVLAVVAAGRTADTGTGRIRDDDAPPVLSFSAPTASEGDSGPTTVSFEVESSAESGKVVTVDYADAGTGTAESGTDYTALAAGTLTFAAGDTTATVGVQVTGDTVNEPDETIVLKLSGAVNATLAVVAGQTADTGAITIDDDDAATATLALTPDSISENGGLSTVTATLAVPSSAVVTIAVSAAPGAGAAAGDFTLSADRTLTFAEGATTSAGLVTVTANADTTDSPNKGVTVSGAASGGHRMADPADATLTVEDDDAAPQVALAVAPSTIDESGANSVATVTATLSHPSSAPTTVTVAAAAALGSNTNAADFALSTATTLTIAAGRTASVGVVTVAAADDADDADELVTVTGTAANGHGLNPSIAAVTLAIRDDDAAAPLATLILTPASIAESGGRATVTAKLSAAATAAVTITVSATEVAPTVAGDFTLSGDTTLTLAAGDTTSSGVVTIAANDDDLDSPDKPVTVSGAASGGGVADPPDATLTITDDDPTPTVTLALSPASVSESGGNRDGDGDAVGPVERGDDGHGDGGYGRLCGGRGRDHRHRRRGDGERLRHGDGRGGGQRYLRGKRGAERDGDGRRRRTAPGWAR